jgi:hypothetical protein
MIIALWITRSERQVVLVVSSVSEHSIVKLILHRNVRYLFLPI